MNPNNPSQTGEVALEVLTPSALESIERASIDVQVSTAHRFPRSLEQFKKRAMDMVQQDLETAESCIYSRPVGKGEDGKQKYAEGASIRMAEIVAACYGNIRFGARIVEQTDRYVKAEGVAHDLESNTAGKSEAMESTVKRNGQPYDERMRLVVAKAALSKALRDSIFRVVPRALCKSIYDAALKVIAGQQKTLEQRRKAAQQWLGAIKVDDARALSTLGVKGWSEVGEEQLLTLTGLKTAMKDNDITIDEAFPPVGGNVKTADLSDLPPVTRPASAAPTPLVAKPEAAKPAATPPSEPEGAPAEPAEPSEPESLPTCRYCGAEVADMSNHECAGLKAAQAPAAPPSGDESKAAFDNVIYLLGQHEITPEQCLAWCAANKVSDPKKHKTLGDLSTNKLMNLGRMLGAPKTVEAIKATKV